MPDPNAPARPHRRTRLAASLAPALLVAAGALSSSAAAGAEVPAEAPPTGIEAAERPEPEAAPTPCEVRWDCTAHPPFHCDGRDAVRYAGLCEDGLCRYVELRMRCRDGTVCMQGRRGPGCGVPVEEPPTRAEVERARNPLGEVPPGVRQLLLNATVRFEVAEALLDRRDERLLDEVAEALRAHPGLRVRVDGHTDDSGSRRRNLQLARERAETVRSALVSRGVPQAHISTRAVGSDEPVVPNTSERNRSFNRRAEIVIESSTPGRE